VITDGNVPVPGVWVSAYQADQGAAHVLADDAGNFVFPELPEGHFRVSAQASGYNEAVLDGVAHGSRGLRLLMLPLSTVSGRVVESNSALPIAEFDVVYLDRVPADSAYWQEMARTGSGEWQSVSDAAGAFVLPGVASGKAVAIGARAAGFAPAYIELDPLGPDEVSPLVTLALHRAAGVEGRVVDASRRPVEGVAVHFGDDERKPVEGFTDAEGRFSLADLAPIRILLTATHPDFADQTVEVAPANPPAYVEIVLVQGGRIEGAVFVGDEPVPGAVVVAGALGRNGFQRTTSTDAAGKFWFAGLPPGAAEVFVDLPRDDEMDGPHSRLQQRVPLGQGGVTRVAFRFPDMTSALEGVIRIRGQAPTSATLRGRTVGVGGESYFSAVSEDDGSYYAEGLLSGDAWVEVVATTASGAERRHNFALTIPEAAVIRHDITLAGTAVLTGTVSGLNEGETGEVMVLPANITVDEADMAGLARLQSLRSARATLQPDGQFRAEGLDPGGYTLLAVVFRPDPDDGTDVLSNVRVGSAPVVLQPGGTVRITLHLARREAFAQ
jgi:hypothetical protein